MRLLPQTWITNVNLAKLILYPFYLIGQMYLACFSAMKFVITDVDIDVAQVKTRLKDGLLRTLLANSITLTPGTVLLDMKDDMLSILYLKEKSKTQLRAENIENITSKISAPVGGVAETANTGAESFVGASVGEADAAGEVAEADEADEADAADETETVDEADVADETETVDEADAADEVAEADMADIGEQLKGKLERMLLNLQR